MPNPMDPHSDPFDPGAGKKVDPRDPWTTPGSHRHLPPTEDGQRVEALPERDTPDPGSPGARTLAWTVAIVLFCLTFYMTQCAGPAQSGAPAEAAPRPDSEQSVVVSSLIIKLGRAFERMQPGSSIDLLQMLDDSAAQSPEPLTDQLRAAIAAAELAGAENAIARLDVVQKRVNDERVSSADPLDPEKADALVRDAELLRAIYGGNADGLNQDERDGLVTRHGRLGRIALTFGRPASDPERVALVEGGGVLIAVLFAFGALVALIIPTSLVCMVIALLKVTKPGARAAFVRPTPGGSVYIEMLAAFLVAFLLLQVVMTGVKALMGPSMDDRTLTIITLIAQWPVALAAFWPLLRGVTLAEHARRLGWTRGKGVLREVFAGIFAYLAGLPLVFGAFVVTFIIVIVQTALAKSSGEPAKPLSNPIFEIATSGGIVPILLFLLATIWAPFTEEAIFRGALYRHLRSRMGLLIAAVISALFFGLIHGYSFVLLLPVITLGFNFALMREWRGSLIAPITAHALHNGTILSLVLFMLSQAG